MNRRLPSRVVAGCITLSALVVLPGAASGPAASRTPSLQEVDAFTAARAPFEAHADTDACRRLSAFILAYPESSLLREARACRATACLDAGSSDDRSRALAELHALAEAGPKDWPRALALTALVDHSGRRLGDDALGMLRAALDTLEVVAHDKTQPAALKAHEHLRRLILANLGQRGLGTPKALVDRLLAFDPPPGERAYLALMSARELQRDATTAAQGEKELESIGAGDTEWADDALYDLAMAVLSRQDIDGALAVLERVVRLGGDRSESAESVIASLTAPALSLSIAYIELPGAKAQATLSFRNLSEVKLTLYRADPAAMTAKAIYEEGGLARAGKRSTVVRTWTKSVNAASPHVGGSEELTLEALPAGVYILHAAAGGVTAEAMLHVTPYATVLKVAPGEALIWVADAMTGQAVTGARAIVTTVVESDEKTTFGRREAACDALGLCRVALPAKLSQMFVWAGKGDGWAFAQVSGSWYLSEQERELLGYILTDRPLYRPGDKVGVKVFLRTRGQGPSRPVSGKRLRAIMTDAAGNEIDQRRMRSSAFGTLSYDVTLKKDAPLGEYSISIQDDNEEDGVYVEQGGGTFRVEEYKPPEITVAVEPMGRPRPGEAVRVRVTASLYAGGAVAYAEGRAIVSVAGFDHFFGPWDDEDAMDVEDLWGYGYDGYGYGGYGGYGHGGYGYGYGDRRRRPVYDDPPDVSLPPPVPGPTAPRPPQNGPQPPKSCFSREPRTVSFRTGEDGVAEVEIEPACKDAPDHSLYLNVLVTDLSRREVTGEGSVNVSSAAYFADMKTDHFVYRPGEPIKVRLRAEDANARPAPAALEVRLLRLTTKGEAEVLRKQTQLSGGKGELTLATDAIGPMRLELWPLGAGAGAGAPDGDTDILTPLASTDLWLTSDTRPVVPPWDGLFVITDQRPLQVGAPLRALVVAPHPFGHVLVAIEGDRVHAAQVVELTGRARLVELPLTGAMTPVSNLTVSRLERLEHHVSAQAIRVRGAEAPIVVDVKPAAVSNLPGSALAVDVKLSGAPAGTPAEVAFTAVDRAIFAIESERTDLLSFFARRWQYGAVQTVASLDEGSFRPLPPEPQLPESAQERPAYLDAAPAADLGAPARPSNARKSAVADAEMSMAGGGGGPPTTRPGIAAATAPPAAAAPPPATRSAAGPGSQAGAPPSVRVRKSFGSSGGWAPTLSGSLGATTSTRAKLSDSLTSWKLTAYAVTTAGHLGVGSAVVRTELPLMVRLEGPRFFTERDEVVLSAVVTSRLARAAAVDVSFDVPGLKPLEPLQKRVQVAAGRDTRVDVRYAVIATGPRRVRATVRAGGAADAMEWTLPSLVHGVVARTAFTGALAATIPLDVVLPEERNPKGTRFELTISPSLLGVILDALPYLAEYPYGCVEQTLSRFVPAVAAARVVKELKAPGARVPADLDQMVDAGLKRLYGFQHGDGGWGWWETDATDPRMTAYVIFGLSLAREAGVKVTPEVISRGRAWLAAAVERPDLADDDRAFMAFALATSGGVSKKALDLVFAAREKMTDRGRAFTALALVAAKDPRAQAAIESQQTLLTAVRAGVSGRIDEVWDTCAGVEAVALTLMAASRRDASDPLVATLADFLVLRRQGPQWRTTRDTAFAVYALADVAINARSKMADGSLRVVVNGKEAAKAAYRSGGADLQSIVLGDAAFQAGKNHIEVVHTGGTPAGHYAALFDVYDVAEDLEAHDSPAVEVRRSYTVLGQPGAEAKAVPLTPNAPLQSGEHVRVELELVVKQPLQYVVIEDFKPAGLEPIVQRSGPEACGWQCTHAELRPDRVAIFMGALAPGKARFSYELRAEVPGRFHGLPAQLTAMYAPEVRASSDEVRVEVRDAPPTVAQQPGATPR